MASQDDDKSSINWLRNRLYSRTNVPKPRERRKLRPDMHQVTESWDDIDQAEDQPPVPPKPITPMAKQKKETTMLTWILIGSFAFFVLSLGYSAFLFMSGSQVVSNENIDIEIEGPVAVPGGEELALSIGIVNRNAVPLELVDLIIDYPDGTRSANNLSVEMQRLRESIGTIEPGERKKTTVRAVLFGEEESQKDITITLEYRIEGSNAILYKERNHNVLLSSAPVALKVDSVKELTSGQEVEFTVRAISNSTGVLEDVLVTAEYPFGFEFIQSTPKPAVGGNTVWNIGDMQPGEEREINIRGYLLGQDSEQRIFRFETGVQDKDSPSEIAASFSKSEVPITIKQPFIQLAMSLDGDSGEGEHVVRRGDEVRGDISWVNNLETTIFDGVIEVKLSGPAVDKNSIDALRGFYRSQDNTLIWNSENNRDFEEIKPGDRGSVRFLFKPLPVSPEIRLENPEIQVEASVRGRRLDENDVPEAVTADVERTVLVASDIFFTSKAVYTTGPFENSGPLPPRAEQETTYTIVWTVANTSNDMTNVRIASHIPSYVEYLDIVSPTSEDVRYNPTSGDIVWNVGDVPTGLGYTSQAREVAFKVSFTPSLSQVGQSPNLIDDQYIEGLDLFTNSVIQSSRRGVTIQLVNDAGAPRSSGRVTQ